MARPDLEFFINKRCNVVLQLGRESFEFRDPREATIIAQALLHKISEVLHVYSRMVSPHISGAGTPASRAAAQADWGKWLAERARFIGFRRQRDLATFIGCSEDHLSKWMQMSDPPLRMRKGNDAAIAEVLQISRSMLFHEWQTVKPADAPRVFNLIRQLAAADREVPHA